MKIKEERYFNDKYGRVGCLLCYFLEDTYFDEGDMAVIEKYVAESEAHVLQATLDQLEVVLALEPFPADWIMVSIFGSGTADPVKCKAWTREMTTALEIEARKVGKLK